MKVFSVFLFNLLNSRLFESDYMCVMGLFSGLLNILFDVIDFFMKIVIHLPIWKYLAAICIF